MSTVYFILQQTMFFMIPLLVVSLGGLFSEKSGITNIALEGIMIIGAFFGVITMNLLDGVLPGQLLLLVSIAVAGLVGGLYSMLHAWASIRLKADQTISGTALNLFAPAFCIFAARALFGAKQIAFTDRFHIAKVPLLGDIPAIGKMFFTNCYLTTYLGIALLIAAAFLFKKTRFGMWLSACGEHPEAAASVGIRVAKMRYIGVAVSGVLGGIGGIIFIIPTSTNFSATVAGYGFLSLAVLILGRWKPLTVLAASFFFGLLKALSSSYSGISFLAKLPIPSEVYKAIPYVLTLVVLAISSKQSRAPKALGEIYDDGSKPENPKKKRVLVASVAAVLVGATMVSAVIAPVSKRKNAVSDGYGADLALLVESTATVDDKSYLQNIWEAIVHYTDDKGITRKYYQAKDGSDESLEKCVRLAAKGNAKFIVVPTNSFETTIHAMQKEYPDRIFLMFDSVPVNKETGKEEYCPNTLAISFAEQEAGFLAGYASVMDGFRSFGFVGGMAVTSVVRYGYGFVAGCDYAAKELGLKPGEVTIKYQYAGTFAPNPESQAMASAWYHSGVEVIFACAGGLGNSIIKAAENEGGYVIEPDQDKSDESETVITSAVKDVDLAIAEILDLYNSDELEAGQKVCLSTAENCVKLPMETARFRTFSEEDYDKIFAKLAAGEIKVPDDTAALSADQLDLQYVTVENVK